MAVNSILESVGNTPLVQLKTLSSGNVFAKAGFLNPSGSIKDRVARYIVERAQEDGQLQPDMTIIEATSGNTAIGLTLVGVQKGHDVICVMPENVSQERKKIIRAFGRRIVFTPAEESLSGSPDRMQEITRTEPGKYFVVNQFVNPRNPKGHYHLVGTSSGANVSAALNIDNGRNRVVTVLPDRAERYFSTALL
jgi:cysteine synthase A